MKKTTLIRGAALLALTSGLLAACGGGGDDTTDTVVSASDIQSVQTSNFLSAGLSSPIATVSCTLSGGTATTCYKIVTTGAPADHGVGPFCPSTTTSAGAGMWFESGTVYDLTGEFIKNLATFYKDTKWKLYDASNNIIVTDTQALFEAAAIPNTTLNNYCVEGKMSYVGGGISRTVLIPVTPVVLSSGMGSISQSGVGVALNGIVMDAPAPVANIKAAYTIAAMDDNGGHINPHTGYHYHAATGSSHQVASSDGHAAMIGYALDGFAIYALNSTSGAEASGLDTCRGHTDSTRGYHYHAASPGENMFIGCFKGQQGSSS